MIKFQKISNGSFDYQSSEKTYKISGPTNTYVVSPYNGVVVSIYNSKCSSGYLLIEHTIQDNKYYSQFCNIGKVIVSKNDVVRQGSTIGKILNDSDEITYSLLNDSLKKINPTIFFNGYKPQTLNTTQKTQTTTSQKNPNWVNSFTKSPTKKTKKQKDNDDDDDYTNFRKKKEKDFTDYSLLDLALSPFSLLHKGSKKLGKTLSKAKKGMFDFSTTKKDDEESLNEEVNRIKKLL